MKLLSEACVGEFVEVGGVTLRVSLTSKGCEGCYYDQGLGAKLCQFSPLCFANGRWDKRSVKFIKVE